MKQQDAQKFTHSNKNAGKRLAWLVVGIGSIFSILLIVLLFAVGKDEPKKEKHVISQEVIDLLEASPDKAVEAVEITSSQVGINLPQGGWVQQTDSLGNLVQQYRCEALDPNPASLPSGWIEMQKPEVELFLSDNQLVRITGDTGIANAPNRMLESGEIAGHVVVSMFEIDPFTNIPSKSPSMVLTTPQASFDNFIGEITCDSEVRIESPTHTLVGRKLAVRFNDLEERIEFLKLDELDYIEFRPTKTKGITQQPALDLTRLSTSITTSTSTDSKTSNHRVRASAIGSDPDFYIVSLLDNVTIIQGDKLTGRYAHGNKLTIAFSNDSESTVSTQRYPEPRPSMMSTFGITTTIAATALATQPLPIEPPTRVTCDGGLVMVPLQDASLFPSSPTETRIELFGTSESPAQLIDHEQNISARGLRLQHEIQSERSDLFGTPASLLMEDMLMTSNHLWIVQSEGNGGAIGAGQLTNATPEFSPTTLQWEDSFDFTFADTDSDQQGALEEVICRGGVVLNDQGSTLTCGVLTVQFEQTADGDSNPSLAIATGNVKATSDTQILWSDEARVTFSQVQTVTSGEGKSMFGGSKADTMHATGDVQVLLEDGGRAFCNHLEGALSQDIATLKGNVVIAYKRMLMNRGERATLTLDRTSGKGKWIGPGQAMFLEHPLDVSPKHRIDKPTLHQEDARTASSQSSQVVSMRANWTASMHLDQTFNEGAGAIDLSGNVDIRSHQAQNDRSQMTGQDLRLEFINALNEEQEDDRQLQTVIAKNNAQIEHRLWPLDNPEAPPVVYYIGGNHIEFDTIQREALVVGNGELVLRDPRKPHISVHQSSLAGRGTTRFTWDKKLKTTKLSDQLYRIEMSGNVEMIHKGLDGSIGMLTSDKIEAIAIDPQINPITDGSTSQISLRGMDLQQLLAQGSVYVATVTRRVDCDNFEYNLQTGFAKLTADHNRTVSIVTQGSPQSVRATSVVWNMDPAIDTISVKGLQGTSPN